MSHEFLLVATIESSVLLLLVWFVFQVAPAIPANWKAWIWRLAFVKAVLGFVPMGSVVLHVLPPPSSDPNMSLSMATFRDIADGADLKPLLSPRGKLLYPPPAAPGLDPLYAIWGLGAAVVFGLGWVGRVRTSGIVRRAKPVTDPAVLRILEELLIRAAITRPELPSLCPRGEGTFSLPSGRRLSVRLLSSSEVGGAMLIGGFRPAIVLPASVGTNSTSGRNCAEPDEDLMLMLAHEVAHIARRDLLWFGAMWVAQALLFFNPIAWAAIRSARQDHESATDRLAVELAETPVQTYAEMLLRTTVVSRMSLVPGALSMAESFRNVHQRLEVMKHFHRKPSLGVKSASLVLALLAIASMPTYVPAASAFRQQTRGGKQMQSPVPPLQGMNQVHVHTIFTKNVLVDVDFDQYDVVKAVKALCKQVHALVNIDPRVKGIVTVSLRNVGFEMAMANVLRQVDATYEVRRGVYYVVHRTSPPPSGVRRPSVSPPVGPVVLTMHFERGDVREVLRQIFKLVPKSFSIAPEVQGPVNLDVKNAELDTVLGLIAKQLDLKVSIVNGVYFITKA